MYVGLSLTSIKLSKKIFKSLKTNSDLLKYSIYFFIFQIVHWENIFKMKKILII